jgi:hypothetical protein
MLFSLNIVAGCSDAECREPTKRRAVPSAPGVATDTPPQSGCRIATLVAIRELLENPTANRQRIRSVDLAATFGLRMGTC